MGRQLTLGITLNDEATFSNFYSNAQSEIIFQLKQLCGQLRGHRLFLWGNDQLGKTHLLQAACHEVASQGLSAAYIPCKDHLSLSPSILEGMENLDLVCCDDLDALADQVDWQEALFHFYNRSLDSNTALIISANAPPKKLNFKLADLISRLSAMVCYQIQALSDEDKILALQLRAQKRGLKLPTEVAKYMIERWPRKMGVLMDMLNRLDQASLESQRHLTIPFVRGILL